MSIEQWEAFLATVERELTDREIDYRLEQGTVWAVWVGDEPSPLLLLNLAQKCAAAPADELAGIISEHFDVLLRIQDEQELFHRLCNDLAAARPLLKLRVYPRDSMESDRSDYLVRDVTDDLVAVLCFDLPNNVVTVPISAVSAWVAAGATNVDDLWFTALANVRQTERGAVETVDIDNVPLTAMTGESFFTATQLLLIGDFADTDNDLGVVAAVPNRHTLLWHALGATGMNDLIAAMLPIVTVMHANGPGSVSPNLYWCRRGTIVTLPIAESADSYEFMPPIEFEEDVMDALARRAKMN